MADTKYLKILKQSIEDWNKWWDENDKLRDAGLREAMNLFGADLSGANLRGVNLSEAYLREAHLSGADLSGANLREAYLIGADLSGAKLREADLSEADLSEADLRKANLRKANLRKANLIGVNLFGADLNDADLSEALLSGANLIEASLRGTNLSEAYIRGSNLSKANLRGTNLRGTNLNQAHLSGADLREADFREANLSEPHLSGAHLSGADLNGADLSGANLENTNFVETRLEGSNISNSRIYGMSAWNLKTNQDTKQYSLIITHKNEPEITVDNLEVAQFVYLLLNNEKIRDIINTIGEKGVLILGLFTEERKAMLDTIREKLRELGFVPMMFDFEKPTQRDFTETIKTLAGMSKFIIADITNPKSSPLELQATMPDYMIPFVPIIQEDEEPFAMFQDLQQKYGEWVLDVLKYDSADNLLGVIEKAVVKPALDKADQLLIKKTEGIRDRHVKDYLK